MAITEQPEVRPPRAGFSVSRWSLRILLSLVGLAAGLQPVSIGQYLDGRYALLQLHSTGATLLESLGLLLIPIVIWYVLAGGRRWVLLTLLLAVAIEVQAVMGYSRVLAVHIPLGVAVVGGAIGLAIWSWTPSASRYRARRTRQPTQEPTQERQRTRPAVGRSEAAAR